MSDRTKEQYLPCGICGWDVPAHNTNKGMCPSVPKWKHDAMNAPVTSNQDTNRDKVLRREVVKVSDGRLREMQAQAISFEGVGDYEYHWHWAAVVNELIALRAHETPAEPPPGLLMSMVIRMDHGLGVPGYYDQPMFGSDAPTHKQRLEAALVTARQMWEEVVGQGFYRPERESFYAAKSGSSVEPSRDGGNKS